MITDPGAALSIVFLNHRQHRGGRFIEPVGDERYVALEDFAEALGDFAHAAVGLSADVAENDLLPAALAAKFKRLDHRTQANVPFADRGARLGIDVAADEHRRARRNIAERVQARNAGQIVLQLKARHGGGRRGEERTNPRDKFFGGCGHDRRVQTRNEKRRKRPPRDESRRDRRPRKCVPSKIHHCPASD
jgi:hypothetical protein